MQKPDHFPVKHPLIVATILAFAIILWGALFLIAPIWQIPTDAAPYRVPEQNTVTVHPSLETAEPVNVNTADAEELMRLPGIGPAKAQAILEYREAHGPFSSLEEVEKVNGISLRMVESWAGLAVVTETGDADTE